MCWMKCGKRFYEETEQIVGQFKMLVAYTTPAKDINTTVILQQLLCNNQDCNNLEWVTDSKTFTGYINITGQSNYAANIFVYLLKWKLLEVFMIKPCIFNPHSSPNI